MVRPRGHHSPVVRPAVVLPLRDVFQELARDGVKDIAARDTTRIRNLDRPRKVGKRILGDGLEVHACHRGVRCWLLERYGGSGRRVDGMNDLLRAACDVEGDGVGLVAMMLEVGV